MTDLFPCPFCTSKAVEIEEIVLGDGTAESAQVECPACLARGPEHTTLDQAARAWNERDVAHPAQGTVEPVAWRVLNDFGHWYITQDKALADTYRDIEKKDVRPLYTAPPAPHAALREAVLRKALAFYDGLDRPHEPGEAALLDAMQAALQPEAPAPGCSDLNCKDPNCTYDSEPRS